MAEALPIGKWRYRMLFVGIAGLLFFVQLLPLDVEPGRFPGPDVLLLLAVAWVLRQPDFVPVTLIAAVFLLADILFLRPLGLWTALVVIGLEYLRSRSVVVRDWSFAVEWLMVAATISAIFLLNTLVLAVFVVESTSLGLVLLHMIVTILAYPLVVVLGARAMGLRKVAPGEVDVLGHKQ